MLKEMREKRDVYKRIPKKGMENRRIKQKKKISNRINRQKEIRKNRRKFC